MRYWVEKLYPFVGGFFSCVLFYKSHHLLDNLSVLSSKLIDSSLVVSGTLLGFLLTITTLIGSIDTRRMKFIKAQNGFPILMSYLKEAIFLNIVMISLVIILPFMYAFTSIQDKAVVINTLQIGVLTWSWLASIRFSVIFIKTLTDEEK